MPHIDAHNIFAGLRRNRDLNDEVPETTPRNLRVLANATPRYWNGVIVDGLAIQDALRELALLKEGGDFLSYDDVPAGADPTDEQLAAMKGGAS